MAKVPDVLTEIQIQKIKCVFLSMYKSGRIWECFVWHSL